MKEEIQYCQHLVCMMDLLGQKEMYKTLEHSQVNPKTPNEFHDGLVKFIRSIEYFKVSVDSFFHGVNNYDSIYNWPVPLSEFLKERNINLCKLQRFSDGIVVYVPLGETEDTYPISSVVNALYCTASTMLTSLAIGNPIRVGIGIGGGVEIDEGELFGPAIGHAHEMESKRAIYPRVAIHERVMEYLNCFKKPKVRTQQNIHEQLDLTQA